MRNRHRVIGWLALTLLTTLVGCGQTLHLALPPVVSPVTDSDPTEKLSTIVSRYRALQRASPTRIAQAIDKTKTRFSENPSREDYQRLVSFMALPNVSLAQKSEILELLETTDSSAISTSTEDLLLVVDKLILDAVRYEQRTQKLTAVLANRNRRIAELDETVSRLLAAQKRCQRTQTSLERQLQSAQDWALRLRHQLDEIGRIEKSIEDRRQSTPAELPRQNGQTR